MTAGAILSLEVGVILGFALGVGVSAIFYICSIFKKEGWTIFKKRG